MECKCCCEYCRKKEIEILRNEIKEDIKRLKFEIFDSFLYIPDEIDKRAKLMYEKVIKLNKLERKV